MEIPKGYRKLRRTEIIRKGDKFDSLYRGWVNSTWIGTKVIQTNLIYIRKIARKKKKASK